MSSVLVFNKVRSSFVDGYGIRTTIFLKGCPLRCKWCCNPEGQSFEPELRVIYEDCNGCGRCLEKCEKKALSLKDGLLAVDRNICDGCGICISNCSRGALEIFGKSHTVDDIFEYVVKDKNFYDISGGGLTIGGGEASCFPEFCMELIDKCHAAGIKVAVDTCGYTISEDSLEVLKVADLLLYDLKGFDRELHKENTGVSNEKILENLKVLGNLNKSIIIRIPVITGYNDSDEEINAVIEFLKGCERIERVDIIPVHEYGKSKYRQIGKPYTLNSLPVPPERQLQIVERFKLAGFTVQIGG